MKITKAILILLFLITMLLPVTGQDNGITNDETVTDTRTDENVSETDTTGSETDETVTNNGESDSIEGKLIKRIIYKGLIHVREKEIKDASIIKESMPVDINLIEEDYQELMALNYFDDIIVSYDVAKDEKTGTTLPGMIDLIYEFKEKPVVKRILFKGNENMGIGFLRSYITIKANQFIKKSDIITDLIKIEEKYKEKGFNYVKVDYEIFQDEEMKKNLEANLIFNITEGPETYIESIEIQGNVNYTDFAIKNKMKTKERKFFGLQKGTFLENTLNEDIENLITFYRNNGYYNIEILKPEVSRTEKIEETVEIVDENEIVTTEKKEVINIILKINEGLQYRYGGITLKGNKVFSIEDLTYFLRLREGQIYNHERFIMDLYSINMKYRNSGYIETRITERPVIDKDKKTISYEIDIRESSRSYIEAVYFRGNEKTKDYVLYRTIHTKVGDILDQSSLEMSRISLQNLNFFSKVTYELQEGSSPGLLKIIYVLEEQSTAEFKFGLQIATSSWPPEVTLFGELAERNFLGRQLTLSGKVDLSMYKQGISVNIQDPWFLNYPWSLGGSLNFYHNWTQKVLRKLTPEDYENYSGDDPTEDDVRTYYNEKYANNDEANLNYIGADGPGSWGNLGLHDINFEFQTNTGYRFLKYFSVSGSYSLSPIYTFLPTVGSDSESDYISNVNEINSQSYRELLLNNSGWSVKSKLSTTFSISTTKRRINPHEGLQFSLTTSYTWGHFDSIGLNTKFTYYLKLLDLQFGDNWVFNNIVVFNVAASFLFPGFRNLGGELNGKSTEGKGPILYPSDYLYVDGFFVGRGWGASIATTNYEGRLTNKQGYARFDASVEYRVPIHEQFFWLAAFVDMVNLVEGPTRRYVVTDVTGAPVTIDGNPYYATDYSNSWMWWNQLESNDFYNDEMTNWYGLENWYGSVGVGFQIVIPQLPLSFYVVKRFKVNYNGGFEWVGNDPDSPNLDFVLSIVGMYF